ncbi:MAG: tRNA (adenosine(37)-N6)-threonylcarbamoyltransferase complex dimerization subunit type 1 TsaB [Chloroflexi bacterium]|nr:tRNA (adenosine(37)-N6)-threonylcarbamoyltransferase complex dimerization subunit type 1 TsaB [Chloroflexota bacterium]
MQLAVDTSTEYASIALSQGGKVLSELTWRCGQSHTVELMPSVLHLMEMAKANVRDIDAVFVARGPGSFNGLRVGISTAKGLVFSLEIPIIGVGTLEALAYQHIFAGLPVCAILEAGRGEVAAAVFQRQKDVTEKLQEEHITMAEKLCEDIQGRILFCGEMKPETLNSIKAKLGERAVIVSGVGALRRAAFIAELGWQRLERGDVDDPVTLQPLYLRRPYITMPKKAEE